MPKRPRSGPPYIDVPDEVYVVVTNPWGMHNEPRLRGQGDFNRIASWARFALQQTGLTGGQIPVVECIYGMGTRDEIILQFPGGTDILPLLGRHRWAAFWKHCPSPNDPRSTSVFLYNWRNNGDPANHNWTENYPSSLPLDTVPARTPYPAPFWVSPPPTLTNLVLPIPRPPVSLPISNQGCDPDEEQHQVASPPSAATTSPAIPQQSDQTESDLHVAQGSVSNGLFRPYEPPSQHPSHARFLNRPQGREALSSQVSPPSQKFIKKLDPYELEEDALDLIRSSNCKEEDIEEVKLEEVGSTIHFSVKAETQEIKTEEDDAPYNVASGSGYQPSQALIDAFNSLRQNNQSPQPVSTTHDLLELEAKIEDDDDAHHVVASNFGYQPSQGLIDAFKSLHRHEQSPPSIPLIRGHAADGNLATLSPSGDNARLTLDTCVVVKRECEDNVARYPERGKKIKIEED